MCINPKNNAYESCKQFRSISSSAIMFRKSLHVRTVISHFVEIGEEGGVRVCGDAVLRYFWCGFAVIFILTRGIAVFKH